MADSSYVRASFAAGEWSQLAQGRTDKPEYLTALNVCLNGLPIESGAWTRRGGFRHAYHTRNGAAGKLIKFDFQQTAPYNLEFTDTMLRCRTGPALAMTNDAQVVVAISTANPCVVTTTTNHGWATGDQGMFSLLGATCPLLQNRQFKFTKTGNTTLTLTDALTGATIDGATLGVGALAAGATLSRILEIATPYVSGAWAATRSVQTDKVAVLVNAGFAPQSLQVTAQPTATAFATFSLGATLFQDGPYLDAFANGVQANPSGKTGNVTITLGFPAYDATASYAVGAFVTSASVNYISLVDQNIANTPVTSPTQWAATSAATAINSGQGFLGTDVGRLVRLYSIPAAWVAGNAYVAPNVVSYNPTGAPGAETFWQALQNSTGKVPGTDLANWGPVTTGAAIWTWGKIISLSTMISQSLAGSVNIGNMTANGGIAASFDGVPSKPGGTCSAAIGTDSTDGYVGKNYSGASAQKIASGTIYPSTDAGFTNLVTASGQGQPTITFLQVVMRAKATAPASANDGTILGSTVLVSSAGVGPGNTASPITIVSNDQTTAWNYVWFEVLATWAGASATAVFSGQVQFFNPPGSATGNAIVVQLLGAPLLYTTPIITWRLGAYSNTTGWPSCGAYSDGRIWLSGAIPNRFDACVANGLNGATLNFAPTDQNGVVAASNAISYTLDAEGANPILWMSPNQQGIAFGTKAGEGMIVAPTTGGISPLNISARLVTNNGCANIEPRRTEHTLVFVQKFGRKVMEYFADVFSGKFTAPNLSWPAKHLTKAGFDEIAYQQETAPVIWARVKGALIGCTYKRDTLMTSQGPSAAGWHRHTLGSARTVESLCVGPSVGGNIDALSIISNDTATNVRHVEILTDLIDEGTPMAQAWYLDNAVNPTSTTTSNITPAPYGGLTLNGLWHLNGKTVQAWIGGLDCGLQEGGLQTGKVVDFVVANGSITIPYGDGVSAGSGAGLFTAAFAAAVPLAQMVVGFTFVSDGQLVRPHSPQESGARAGPAMAKKRRTHYLFAQLEGTQGVSFGTTFAKLDPAAFRDDADAPYAVTQSFTGIFRMAPEDGYSFDSMVCWRVTRPYPCNVAAIGGILDTQDV